MSLSLSVILCTKDRPADLHQCIMSILNGRRLPQEIVVIDDGTLDPRPIQTLLERFSIEFHYRRKSPPNTNASRNLAVSIAGGDILSFLDDDVVLDSNYYASVMRTFEEDSEQQIAGITGAIKVHTHPLKRAFLRFFGLESSQPGKVQPCGAATLVRAGEICRPTRVDWLSGCNMNLRRWVFKKYRFNEQDSGYSWGDDRDFSYPIGREYLLIALPEATLVHKKSPTGRASAEEMGRMEIFHLGRFFVTSLHPQKRNWIALGWAFLGIFLKNLLNCCAAHKRSRHFKQLRGNFEGLRQFLAFLREHNGKKETRPRLADYPNENHRRS
ncbi:MAG: glycosyltransferase [Anaerolineales bacterium]|nr:glycosyltransferase [Anaerolineales bacterium]MDW8161068.1 glycosyltransferase [Anaerolineales bacterium]